ncbi:ATP-binding protein [Paractinoplanes atraurantiacus]|uniref:Anti-sigma regulatory factor (Ser/Thr protein kinase) n=1 Tax=Paractinoplanes atraurantiacus TaxID=1036182 RepID=A0A285K759_9ACTN|nr:ATP-binding protein [Actinoplanes atraurantiacus]SNY68378.1 Anti-sigma regulatory factor (Ser/Thr protein kinase) [Actinoplanes atraurantiacus]
MSLPPGSGASEPVESLFPASPEVLRDIRAFVTRLAREAGFTDRERERMVLVTHELSANAVEHGATGVVCVRWEDTDQGLWITVSDDGVFESGGGSGEPGRGLRIVLGLSDEVTIRPGRRDRQGTEVRLRVPVPAGRASTAAGGSAPPRVLLVDGDRFAGRSLSSFLDAEGFPTTVAASAEAGRAAAASPPRLAIVDLTTSRGLTVPLCEDLMRAGVPVLAISILPPPEGLRASRFLRKPVHPLEVLAEARRLTEPSPAGTVPEVPRA